MHTASQAIEIKTIPPPGPSARMRPHDAAARALRWPRPSSRPITSNVCSPSVGRGLERRLRRAGKLDRPARHAHLAGRAMLRRHHHVARQRMRMRQRSGDAEHRRMRNVELGSAALPTRHGCGRDDSGDLAVDLVAVLAPPERRLRVARPRASPGRSIASHSLTRTGRTTPR